MCTYLDDNIYSKKIMSFHSSNTGGINKACYFM